MKYCNRCQILKYPDHFSKNIRTKDALQQYCKLCNSDLSRELNNKRRLYGATVFRKRKECQDCFKVQSIANFGKKTSSADGYQSYCKPCWRTRVKHARARLTA